MGGEELTRALVVLFVQIKKGPNTTMIFLHLHSGLVQFMVVYEDSGVMMKFITLAMCNFFYAT